MEKEKQAVEKPSKKMGRPKSVINEKIFDTLIMLPLIKADIAACLSISEDTLDTYVKTRFGITFSVLQAEKRQTFRKNILGKQYELAMRGDRVMLIWLGKQYLGQSEKVETKNETNLTIDQVYVSDWGGTFEPTDVKEVDADSAGA